MANTDDLKRLMTDLDESEELRKKIDETLKHIADAGTVTSDRELVVAAASELGYDISVADLERATADAEELDDAELDEIAGGWLNSDEHGHEYNCFATWHCYTAFLHTESKDQGVSCWSNFSCLAINENPTVELNK